MCLYWPELHLAINIIDDPHSPDFDPRKDPKAKIFSIESSQIHDNESMSRLADDISKHLGYEPDFDFNEPIWRAKNKRLLDELMCAIF